MRVITIRPMMKDDRIFVDGKFTHVVWAFYRTDANTSTIPSEDEDKETADDIRKLYHHFINYLGNENVSSITTSSAMERDDLTDEDHPFAPSSPANWLQALVIFGVNL